MPTFPYCEQFCLIAIICTCLWHSDCTCNTNSASYILSFSYRYRKEYRSVSFSTYKTECRESCCPRYHRVSSSPFRCEREYSTCILFIPVPYESVTDFIYYTQQLVAKPVDMVEDALNLTNVLVHMDGEIMTVVKVSFLTSCHFILYCYLATKMIILGLHWWL